MDSWETLSDEMRKLEIWKFLSHETGERITYVQFDNGCSGNGLAVTIVAPGGYSVRSPRWCPNDGLAALLSQDKGACWRNHYPGGTQANFHNLKNALRDLQCPTVNLGPSREARQLMSAIAMPDYGWWDLTCSSKFHD